MPKTPKKRRNLSHNRLVAGNPLTVDELDIKIIKEMVKNPDARSPAIAGKYGVPLSTLQRRRAKLERAVLKKEYRIDIEQLGWRRADLLIAVDGGKCEKVAEEILSSHGNHVATASLRIGSPKVNLMARAFYRDSQELHGLIERIRTMPSVRSVEWSEVVDAPQTDPSAEGLIDAFMCR